MNAIQSVIALTAALVHRPATRSDLERSRHEAFIGDKLLLAFVALAVAPFYLAFHGVPSPADCLLFSLGLLPMAAAMLVARTGRIVAGHVVVFVGLVGVAATLFLGKETSAGAALAWLIVAQFEAMLANDRRFSRIALVVNGLAFAVFVTLAAQHYGALTLSDDGLFAAAALFQAIVGARGIVVLANSSRDRRKLHADRWRAVAEALGDLVVGFDGNGSVNRVSAACETMLGLPAHELSGRGLFDHVHVGDRPTFLKLVADAAHGAATLTATFRFRLGQEAFERADNAQPRHVWIEMRAKGVAPEVGAPAKGSDVVAILRDVTIARQHEIDLEQANRASEQAIRAKDHFLANMSHELRTPLNAIIGFSEMLGSRTLRPADPEKQREYAGIIHSSGQHLLGVVNSILDMSKIQAGTFAIIPEPFPLKSLIDQCCDIVRLEAQSGHVSLDADCPAALEEIVGDRRACKQIVLNLLSNAVKFTPERGHVAIKARPEGNTMVLSVSDTGIGIAAADMDRLGDPFFQARSTICRPYEGTGLGLSVVRGLIGLHGGSMTIESEIGVGTLVTVRLPLDCRIGAKSSPIARIETIARRQTTELFARAPDMRMKQIA